MSGADEMSTPRTAYPTLLNALVEMQDSPAYAVRRQVLMQAESTILALERNLARVAAERDEALASIDRYQQQWAENKPAVEYKRQRDECRQRAESAEADAGRYRHLRQNRRGSLITMFFSDGCGDRTIEEVEAKIDAARGKA